MSHGRSWTAMELARIHKFQLPVASSARVSHFFDAATCEFCAILTISKLSAILLRDTQRIIQTVKSRLGPDCPPFLRKSIV